MLGLQIDAVLFAAAVVAVYSIDIFDSITSEFGKLQGRPNAKIAK